MDACFQGISHRCSASLGRETAVRKRVQMHGFLQPVLVGRSALAGSIVRTWSPILRGSRTIGVHHGVALVE